MKKILVIAFLLVTSMSFGQGLKAKAITHQVSLSWTATTSSCTGTVGYNIYKGTTPGGESSTPVNTTLISGLSYVDTAVTPLASYSYNAKAFCSTSSPSLSAVSNEVTVVIPGDPQPLPPVMNTPTAQ